MNKSRDTEKISPEARFIFGRNFRHARRAAELTQCDITRITGVMRGYISKVECGKVSISVDKMEVLANAVKVPLWKLLTPITSDDK
ncbi:helix-turn-helix transcriptional regulator [candidate division WWE3 bacterium]|uniref:Helix-turn-helix transcriptional regulator n=1 Tax=candidate division WWE3 bacterium TaxID=2053526 RepID=A0A928TTH2_UNCKA|nr:helix-turn-helix transcriptional regulator [candidate division WWE3 bacterium]